LGAKHLRDQASLYSTEYDWVRKAYKTARQMERDADYLEKK
jgi:hypothetical protein